MSSKIPTAIYVNRELSWLKFNERVLEQAEDERLPLFERMRFISIYGSNLDEFFMVRVGGLYDARLFTPDEIDAKTGMTINEQIDAIYDRVRALLPRVETCYCNLVMEMEKHGIHQVNFDRLSDYEKGILEAYFKTNVEPFLAPQIIDRHHPFPYLSNKEQFVGLCLRNEKDKKGFDFAVIPVTDLHFKRFHIFQNETKTGWNYVLMAPLIYHFADRLFRKSVVDEKVIFRITRNGDLRVDEALYDEDMDWRSQMEQILNKRKRSAAVRLQLSKPVSERLKEYLLKRLDICERAVMVTNELPPSLTFIYGLFGELENRYPELNYGPMPQVMPPGIDAGDSIIRKLDENGDIFLAYPYHGMKTFLDLLDEAAVSPQVRSIKITLYRIASGSKVAQALIKAAENGKDVLVLVELKARFDEEHNIIWSKRLEEAGCTVIYGMENYKVHSKLCVITRREGNKVSYITQVGTGNYNEKTAKQYTDFCLITKNQSIGEEASRVFQTLQLGGFVDKSNHLLVAPLQMKNRFIEYIDDEITVAKRGEPARIILKVNGLSNKDMIDKLIEASQAGVKITLYVRGICCLRAGVPGYTENIVVKSMVGRFLEHPRIYLFGIGKRENLFIGSADWMTRNLLYRVEVGVRVLDPLIKETIMDILDILEKDNVLAREMLADGTYRRLYPDLDSRAINSQYEQYEYFKEKSKNWKIHSAAAAELKEKPSFFQRLINRLFNR